MLPSNCLGPHTPVRETPPCCCSNYMMFEVLETSWETLQGRLDSARTLDDVIHAHNTYLSDIMGKALLHPDSKDVSDKLIEARAYVCTRAQYTMLRSRGNLIWCRARKGGKGKTSVSYLRNRAPGRDSFVLPAARVFVFCEKKKLFQGFALNVTAVRFSDSG